jgi:hypothetical protein
MGAPELSRMRRNPVSLSRAGVGSASKLGSLSVNVFSVANFYDFNQQILVVDGVQDPIVTLSYPIPVKETR